MKILSGVLILTVILFFVGCDSGRGAFEISADGGINVSVLKPEAIEVIRGGLADENPIIRSNAIEVVSETGTRELLPIVAKLLKDEVAPVRFTACIVIGDMGFSGGEYLLRRLVNDRDVNVKIAAAYALTKLGRLDYGEIIRSALKSKDQTVCANAAMLLGKMGSSSDIDLLYNVVRDPESSDKVRIQALEAIAMLGDEDIYGAKSLYLLISENSDDKIMGIRILGALGTSEAKDAIKTMLYEDIWEVRLCAAEQLGRLGDPSGRPEILEYLRNVSRDFDEPSIANSMATMAIGRIGGDSLTEYLPRLLRSRSKLIRLVAAQSVLLVTQKPK
ncbi:MAG TPA: HEAT repeat domain-containing protein [Planctomycetes bacterium]|nr:HEAT repeat domain-containing protein [Planctomycetota bacterium]HIJ70159.1 HEAT repeat domain-containing protein [Planctomycetota bacterium]